MKLLSPGSEVPMLVPRDRGSGRLTRSALAAIALAAGLLARSDAAPPDLRLRAGESATGDIVFTGEEDRVAVDLLAGTKLTFTATPAKKSKLRCGADLLDAAETVVPLAAKYRKVPAKGAVSLVSVPVKTTATWFLAVRGTAAGQLGAYDLVTAATPPKPAKRSGTVLSGAVTEFTFDALAGSKVAITVTAPKGSKLRPHIHSVIGPGDEEADLASAAIPKRETATLSSVSKVPLPVFGTWHVFVTGNSGSAGKFTATATLTPPKPSKTKRDFRGASGGEATAGDPASIEILPGSVAVAALASQKLIAKGTYAGGRTRDLTRAVTWSVRNRSAATMSTAAPFNVVTGVAPGATTAQAWLGGTAAREALVLVGGATVGQVDVVPASAKLSAGDAIRLQAVATIAGADPAAATADVTAAADWAQVGTALSSVAGGRCVGATDSTSQVTAATGGVTSAAAEVIVVGARVVSIALSPTYAELTPGSPSRAFTATATFSDGTTADVTSSCTFASDRLAAATTSGATATRAGNGTAGIRATLNAVTSRSAVVNSGPVALASIQVTGASAVAKGGTTDLAANGTFADGGTRDLTEACAWGSGATATTTVSDAAGTKGRVAGVAQGASPATITAALTAAGVFRSGSRQVTCGAPATASFRIVPAITSTAVGSGVTLRAIAVASDGTVTDVSGSAGWATTNPAAATVADGVVSGVADGGSSITATFDGRTARAVVLAGTGRMTGITLTNAALDPFVGESTTFTPLATFTPSVGGDPAAPVAADEILILASPLDADAASAAVTARSTSSQSVTSAFGGFVSGSLVLAPRAATPRGVTAFPQGGFVVLGGADLQLAAQVRRSDGFVTDQAAAATWSSLGASIVSVGATGLAHAEAKGEATIRAQFSGLQGDALVTVLGDPPVLGSVSPSTVVRGETGVTFTLNGTALDGPVPQVSVSGTGVTVVSGPTPNGAGTQATAVFDVDPSAATGLRDVTYTTAVGTSTKTSAFQITGAAPTVTSIAPLNVAIPAASTQVTLTGTGFLAGDTFTIGAATGVSLAGVAFVNSTTMTGNVTVTGAALPVRLDVTMQQSVPNGGATATLQKALKIGPPDPTVASATPAFTMPGTSGTQTVTVTGTNFAAGITIGLNNAPSGVIAAAPARVSSTVLTFTVTAPSNASYGAIDVDLTNPGDILKTFADVFAIVPRNPSVTSLSLVSLARGVSNVDVTVKGTDFRSGATLTASGTGVTFSSVTVVDSETITAKAAAGASATLGLRDLTVAHSASDGGRGPTLKDAFKVVASAPAVTSAAPPKVGRTGSGGATLRVPLKLTGTDFSSGATVSLSRSGGSGLSVVGGTTVVISDTKLRFDADVAATATTGLWDVKVANPSSGTDSGASGNAKLEVVSESTLVVHRVAPSSGSADGGERVVVQGAGFVRGCRVEFGTEKALNVQSIDQNTLLCTVPAPANPSGAGSTTTSTTMPTEVDVKVTNNPGGAAASATLTKGWAYGPDAGSLVVVSCIPADGSSGVKHNLKSAVLRLSRPANTATAVFSGTPTQGTHCRWFEATKFLVASPAGGFGADRRFLVFSRTGGGNLPINAAGDYVLEVPTAVKSSSGRALTPVHLASTDTFDQWGFTITASADSTGPTVSTSVPAASATGVATTTAATVTFSEAVDPLTITTSSVQLKQASTVLACAIELSDDIRTVTLTPTEELAKNTTYTVSLSSSVADLFGNALGATTWNFTTHTADTTAPTIDAVVLADLPSSVDGSATYIPGRDTVPGSGTHDSAGSPTAFDTYLPTSGWSVRVAFSDTGDGVDPATFSAKSNVSLGGGATAANAELASKFTVTATGATWTVGSSDAFAVQDGVTLTFNVKDKAGTSAASSVITFATIGKDTTVAAAVGGDHDPLDAREVWVLRFDRDVYTASFSTAGATQQVTTTGASNGIADIEEALRINGMWTPSMTTTNALTVNAASVGTNAIVVRLVAERVRETARARFGLGEDGTRGSDAADIEFLLAGEAGSLASVPSLASSINANTGAAWSEMDIGGDTVPNSSPTGYFGTIGQAYFDLRNRRREANLNSGSANSANNNGIFAINLFKFSMNDSGTAWRARVLDPFQAAKGGTPIGSSDTAAFDDDVVLAGTFDRTSGSNTPAQNTRYDQIMDAIDAVSLAISATVAHEIGHSLGLVPDDRPKTGLFGNAHHDNTFTEATVGSENTTHHLDFLGNDVMAPASSSDDSTATGTDFQRFNPMDMNYLRARQVHDEGK